MEGDRRDRGKTKQRQAAPARHRKYTGRRRSGDRYHTLRYILVAVVLLGLLCGAFLGPELVFKAQDRYLCQDTELSMRENLDISVMTTSYEPSLGRRLTDYAQGLAAGTQYYVTSQEFEVTKDLYDRLTDNDIGIYQGLLYTFLDLSYLPYTITDGFSVEQWKQYVIYSEDYAQGVNFILWYLKLYDTEGIGYELLMDAEYGNLYAVKSAGTAASTVSVKETENNQIMRENNQIMREKYGDTAYWAEIWNATNKWGVESRWGLWYELSYQFESMNSYLLDAVYTTIMEDIPYLENLEEISAADRQFLEKLIQEDGLCRIEDGGNTLYIMLYYEEYPLRLDIQTVDVEKLAWTNGEVQLYETYPGFIIGLSDVYGLIPEFVLEESE